MLRGSGSISWDVAADAFLPHADHIEMSGLRVSAIVDYGVDANGQLSLSRHVVWPMLRTIPNDTHASLSRTFRDADVPHLMIDGERPAWEKTESVRIGPALSITSTCDQAIEIRRTLYPSVDKPALLEALEIRNVGTSAVEVRMSGRERVFRSPAEKGVDGAYVMRARVVSFGSSPLEAGDTREVLLSYEAVREGGDGIALDGGKEWRARLDWVKKLGESLVLETPYPELDLAFEFAKVRGAESIFATRGGLMHGPGGGKYYAALWTNDQCEYINPFFPFLGYGVGNEQAINCYRHFARHMDPAFKRDLVSSVIAEELWPHIEWCLEYCHRKTTAAGVIASNCDELENRFPAGDANLCTSALAYDALLSAAFLGEELGKPRERVAEYRARAETLRQAIEEHFGADMSGFKTYRYYEGNTTLRAWICIPLTMGILERTEGTVAALFSDHLWTEDGLTTEAGRRDFWDRSTLYGLRGALAAGATEQAGERLLAYTRRRLLGEHVPYAIEAWPENNQRHLSAESGLYCRVFTEGLFGMRPTGFRSFDCTPRLPDGWDRMAMRNIRAFQDSFDLSVERDGEGQLVRVIRENDTVFSRKTPLDATVSVPLLMRKAAD